MRVIGEILRFTGRVAWSLFKILICVVSIMVETAFEGLPD